MQIYILVDIEELFGKAFSTLKQMQLYLNTLEYMRYSIINQDTVITSTGEFTVEMALDFTEMSYNQIIEFMEDNYPYIIIDKVILE